ncbi:MAG: ATP-dependent helicase [Chloroflexota bacterium]
MSAQTAVSPPLTSQQQNVVNHESGPALVYAVAGAGKTTAMVHRIERLVRLQKAEPSQILATSFARVNVADLKKALRRWPHCRHVDVRTLHSLGRQIIVTGQRLGYAAKWQLDQRNDDPTHLILNRALTVARQENVDYKRELDGLDRQDFLDYVGSCKGNMLYADLPKASLDKVSLGEAALDENGRSLAQQAEPPEASNLKWYLDLYQLYEQVRQQLGLVTFDDMVLTGWELLVSHRDLLETIQGQYEQVLVDEYQDINRAQAELLHQVTARYRNYMAIGDDDQTVYEWRGADPSFILNFAGRYKAKTYEMTENFRCPAAPLTLANEVIRHNKRRRAKRLHLTQGFGGTTELIEVPTITSMSAAIITQLERLQKAGASWDETAVLVRLNAQTPPLEQALITADISYRVPRPFYQQPEIKTLIDYARLAWVENRLLQGEAVTTASLNGAAQAWRQIVHRPKRYISNALSRRVMERVQRDKRPFSNVVIGLSQGVAEDWLHDKMSQLSLDLRWLAENLGQEAHEMLKKLDQRLGYREFLRTSSGFAQTGQGRAASVKAFIDYAKGKGSLLQFMGHLRELADKRVGQDQGQAAVTLSTMHRAKGLEWNHVFIPQVNQEIIPFNGDKADNMEEERRLFYVALTRTRRNLYLYELKDDPISKFLREARWRQTLDGVGAIAHILQQPPEQWEAQEALALTRQIPAYQLQSYFLHWWDVAAARKTAVVSRMHHFQTAVRQQKLQSRLKLGREQLNWWGKLVKTQPATPDSDFPGLAELVNNSSGRNQSVRYSTNAYNLASAKRRAAKTKKAPKPPKRIEVGVWVRCDAGWGQVTALLDGEKRPLSQTPLTNRNIFLHVTLRPDQDAEPIVIDIANKVISFTKAQTIYTCTLCRRFSASSTRTLERFHSRVAHDDQVAFRQEKVGKRPLTDLLFAVSPE